MRVVLLDKKIFIISFNRASDGAIDFLKQKMIKNDIYTKYIDEADYFLSCGDRQETFDFTLEQYRRGKKIIHLWAGEISQGTMDEVYRHSITLMSMMQLCTNNTSKQRVLKLCKAIDKKPNVFVIGNVMLDDMTLDESFLPDYPYNLVLYNPPVDRMQTKKEIVEIYRLLKKLGKTYIWIEPNGDINSDLIMPYVTEDNRPRPMFLALIKHCQKFITNSSCQFYEAPFLMDKQDIISIGVRNQNRESKHSDMNITGASNKIIRILKKELL